MALRQPSLMSSSRYLEDRVNCAIVSDIHGNLPAFQAVLKDIEQHNVKEIWCLGDIVGYGPQPLACFLLAEKACSIIIKGNHEKALALGGGERFNARAKRAIDWTRRTLAEGPNGTEVMERIMALPTHFERKGMLFCHGSPRDPTDEYLMPKDARARPDKINAQFAHMKQYAFVGHSHFPGVFEEGENYFCPPEEMLLGNVYMLDNAAKAIINVGSVGQPRDKNPNSCYVTFDGDSVVYHRVRYDVEKTRKMIYQVPDLDNFLGDRIVQGK